MPAPALFVALRKRRNRQKYCGNRQRNPGDPRPGAVADDGESDVE
jgi:hypothetical protein